MGGGESRLSQAMKDLLSGGAAYTVWGLLGWQDIKQRYRRSMLGPLWITISTGIMVGMLSLLYGALFQQPLQLYAPFVGIGMIVWLFIANVLNEATVVFQSSEAIIKQVRMPLTLHVCRMVWRNVIVLLHNCVIVFPILFLYGKGLSADLVLVPLAIATIAANDVWVGSPNRILPHACHVASADPARARHNLGGRSKSGLSLHRDRS